LPTEFGLLAACTDGLDVIEGDTVRPLHNGTTQALARSPRLSDWAFAATPTGVLMLHLDNGRWRSVGHVPGVTAALRFLAFDGGGELWAGSFQGQVYRLRLDGGREHPVAEVERFGSADGLPPGPMEVLAPAGRLLLRTVDGVYIASRTESGRVRFAPDASWPGARPAFRRLQISRNTDRLGRVWFVSPSGLSAGLTRHGLADWGVAPHAPLPASGTNAVVIESPDTVWIARQDSLLRLQTSESRRLRPPVTATVRRMIDLDAGELLFGGATGASEPLQLGAAARALRFEFAIPSFTEGTVFQTELNGFDRAWSPWTDENARVYTNLPAGEYVFRVRARTGEGLEAVEASLPLVIGRYWYETWLARALGVIALMVVVGGLGRGLNRLRLRRLSDLVERRTAELAQSVEALRDQSRIAEEARAEAERANAARAAFVAAISHEVRAPLNGVIGMTSLLQQTRLNDEQSTYLDTIRSSGEALLGVMNDILDASRLEAGRLELESAPFTLRDAIDDALQLAAQAAAAKNLRLLVEVAADAPRVVIGDGPRVRQMVLNLVTNAVKFTDRGSVCVKADAERDAEGNVILHLAVHDSGPGISVVDQAKLFHPYRQVSTDSARRRAGTGLGLSICRQLAELMHGRIWVESTPGVGATFHIAIPVTTAEAPLEQQGRGRRALIVACDRVRSRDLARTATALGFTVAEIASAERVLADARVARPDVIVASTELLGADVLRDLASSLPGARLVVLAQLGELTGDVPPGALVLSEPLRESKLIEVLGHSHERVMTRALR
jgi:signal transduction histidine kinase